MNLTLVASWRWALVAAGISGGVIAWWASTGAAVGAGPGSHPEVLLWTGWITFALMFGVCAYSLRKFIHKLGWSPEFKMRVPVEALEKAEQMLNDVRRSILLGHLNTVGQVEAEAGRVLRSCGVHKVCRPLVTAPEGPGLPIDVAVRPTEPLGRMATWLHFHVYLGLASGVTLWVHGGLSFGSPMGAILNGLTIVVIGTGVVGTVLFALGPRWMTRAETDMNYEDAFVQEQSLSLKIKEAYGSLSEEQVKRFRTAERTGRTASAVIERTALMKVVETEPAAREELEDVMVLVSQRRRIREDLKGAARVKFWINIWRAVHIPASFILLGFSLIHMISILWY